jgi:hypothetical protein
MRTSSHNIKGVTGLCKTQPVNAFVHTIILYANGGKKFTFIVTGNKDGCKDSSLLSELRSKGCLTNPVHGFFHIVCIAKGGQAEEALALFPESDSRSSDYIVLIQEQVKELPR